MPLSMAGAGEEVILKNINWGYKMKKRLQDMGLTPGVKISVVSNNTNGAFIVNIRGSRLVLGGGVTGQILVDRV